MQEKEKMLQGLLYDAILDESLKKDRINCKLLCQKYNRIDYDKFEKRKELIKQIVAKTGIRIFD